MKLSPREHTISLAALNSLIKMGEYQSPPSPKGAIRPKIRQRLAWRYKNGKRGAELLEGVSPPPLWKKDPWWCQSQGCSSSLADLKLMHPCDQIVIGRRVVHDQVQLADTWVPRACTASLGAQPVAVAIKWITELYADATRSTPIGGFASPSNCVRP